jgi:acetyltransferase-like isoleucine patch superfamily enzyme
MTVRGSRTLSWDWHEGTIPDNVELAESAYIETTHSFLRYDSARAVGARFGEHSSLYKTSMLDVGPGGCVTLGKYALVQGARIICDGNVAIGDYAMISWKVLIMDSYRWPPSAIVRRGLLQEIARNDARPVPHETPARDIDIGRNVWIGFEACLLPGVTVGEGAVVGARAVVTGDVEPFTVVAGNPARVVRRVPANGSMADRELSEFTA